MCKLIIEIDLNTKQVDKVRINKTRDYYGILQSHFMVVCPEIVHTRQKNTNTTMWIVAI